MQEQWKVRRVHVLMPQRTVSGRAALPRRPRASHILIAILLLIENVWVFNFCTLWQESGPLVPCLSEPRRTTESTAPSEQHTEKTANSPLTQGGCRQIVLWPTPGQSATFASGARSHSALSRN